MSCDQYNILVINKRPCHETGCSNKNTNPLTGDPYRTNDCNMS